MAAARPARFRTILATAILVTAVWVVTPASASAQSGGDASTTTLVESDGQSPVGNILPRPNSGQAPDSPNDPGGWQQYLVFALIFAGLATIVLLVTRESRRARADIAAHKPST